MKPWLHVVLYQPEIPPNTGNVMRLCASTGAALHLIHPLGFALDDRRLRRAGLDYRDWAEVQEHDSLQAFRQSATHRQERLFAFTTKAGRPFQNSDYRCGDALLFGPETRGLPDPVLKELTVEQRLRIPMRAAARSLNLSNAVAIAVYHAWWRLGYPGGV